MCHILLPEEFVVNADLKERAALHTGARRVKCGALESSPVGPQPGVGSPPQGPSTGTDLFSDDRDSTCAAWFMALIQAFMSSRVSALK